MKKELKNALKNLGFENTSPDFFMGVIKGVKFTYFKGVCKHVVFFDEDNLDNGSNLSVKTTDVKKIEVFIEKCILIQDTIKSINTL